MNIDFEDLIITLKGYLKVKEWVKFDDNDGDDDDDNDDNDDDNENKQ